LTQVNALGRLLVHTAKAAEGLERTNGDTELGTISVAGVF
jgi:hypothetical protein